MASESAYRVTEVQLALEIRSWKFGFIAVDGCRLLEWGNCRFGAGEATGLIRKFVFLLKTYAPAVVITRTTRHANHPSSRTATQLFQKLRKEAKARSVRFVILNRADVQRYFRKQGCKNKNGIGEIIGAHFQQLSHVTPKARKLWDNEPNMVAVFDAAATAIAFDGLKARQ